MKIFIEKIKLNENGILNIKPQNYSFVMVYRSAKGVYWDKEEQCLYHTPPVEWDVLQWYKQILLAVKSEYGIQLEISSKTVFEDLDSNIVSAIKNK